jgi:hypothetical protein
MATSIFWNESAWWSSSEMLAIMYQSTQWYIPDDSYLQLTLTFQQKNVSMTKKFSQ